LIQADKGILYTTSARKSLFKGVCGVTFVERGNPVLIKIIKKSNTLMTQLWIPLTTAEQVIVP